MAFALFHHPAPLLLRRGRAVTAVAIALLLAGCASGPPADIGLTSEEWSVMSAEQQAAVEDGVVTEREYTAGYEAYVSCLGQAGFELEELGRPGGFYEFGIPEEAVDAGADETCYLLHYNEVDSVWQREHPRDDEDVKVILRQCLEAEGLDTEGTQDELTARIVASDLGFIGCMEEFG